MIQDEQQSYASINDYSINANTDEISLAKGADYYEEAPRRGRSKTSVPEAEVQQKSVLVNFLRAFLVATCYYYPGYYLGIMNPMGKPMTKWIFGITVQKDIDGFLGNANLFLCAGTTLCCIMIGPLSNLIGRIRLLYVAEFLSLFVGIAYTIDSMNIFYLVRFLSGIIMGVFLNVAPISLSELFPSSVAGSGGLFCYFSACTAMLLGWLTPYFFDGDEKVMASYFRWILGGPAIFGVFHLILMLVGFKFGRLESPVYFMNKV